MAQLVTATPEGLSLRRELAGAGSRFSAALCDGALLVLAYLTVLMFAFVVAQTDPTGLSGFVVGVLGAGFLLVVILYFLLAHLLLGGQTPGKRLFRLRVISADGFPATFTQHLLRSILWPIDVILPVPMPFGLLGLLVIISTSQRQRIGDIVAGTVVLREPARREAREERQRVPSGPRTLSLPPGIVARLGDEEHLFLRDLLRRQGLEPAVQRSLMRSAAAHFSELLDVEVGSDPRLFLREVHRELREARSGRVG